MKRVRMFLVSAIAYIAYQIFVFAEVGFLEYFFVKWFFVFCICIPFSVYMFLRYKDTTPEDKKHYTYMFWCVTSAFLLFANFVFGVYQNYFK